MNLIVLMGYDYEDAWNDLKDIFSDSTRSRKNSKIQIAWHLDEKTRKWIRDKMEELEKNITS